jgi:hypothetical protein
MPSAGQADMMILLCSCGFATDDRDWLDGHLFEHPGHHVREAPRARLAGYLVPCSRLW